MEAQNCIRKTLNQIREIVPENKGWPLKTTFRWLYHTGYRTQSNALNILTCGNINSVATTTTTTRDTADAIDKDKWVGKPIQCSTITSTSLLAGPWTRLCSDP